ncbi:hypothetical protein BZA77DRAFT_346400 [Pyronema omphalodes]|nr:hypothetical protein BZA77DRAFT_346400 [Pyronema omphalodes]
MPSGMVGIQASLGNKRDARTVPAFNEPRERKRKDGLVNEKHGLLCDPAPATASGPEMASTVMQDAIGIPSSVSHPSITKFSRHPVSRLFACEGSETEVLKHYISSNVVTQSNSSYRVCISTLALQRYSHHLHHNFDRGIPNGVNYRMEHPRAALGIQRLLTAPTVFIKSETSRSGSGLTIHVTGSTGGGAWIKFFMGYGQPPPLQKVPVVRPRLHYSQDSLTSKAPQPRAKANQGFGLVFQIPYGKAIAK